ncbi:MAG: helix-turn-helix transcriptional regulator, partial [Pseudomonadales bacterium]|nr:helix-turn-helix transcriptional regulator [Pseudomonadales bacterium]
MKIMIPALEAIFGNRTAASVLLYIENYESGYAKRIADTFEMPVSVVQDQLRKLESAGVLISRTMGRTRVFEFNPRNPSVRNLRIFLKGELSGLPESETKRYFRQRQRPRRTGKPIE